MTVKERKTKVTSVAINEYLTERAKKLVDTGQFSSVSDVITTALTEFLYKNEHSTMFQNCTSEDEVSKSEKVLKKSHFTEIEYSPSKKHPNEQFFHVK